MLDSIRDAPKTPEDAPKTHEDAPKIYEDARNCAKFYRVRVVPAQIMASVILCAISQWLRVLIDN